MTASGRLRPIKWIGRRSYAGRFIIGRKDVLPLCIKAGALDDNVPARDLWISPNHAMYFDTADGGVLVEAKDIVNGVSVVRAESIEHVEYFHVELETHDVIIAEGALSETFIDDDSRGMFHNSHEYRRLYAEEHVAPAHYFAPRVDEGYELETIRQRIALRAGLATGNEATPGRSAGLSIGSRHVQSKAGRRTSIFQGCRSVLTFSREVNSSARLWPTATAKTSSRRASALAGTVLHSGCRQDLPPRLT